MPTGSPALWASVAAGLVMEQFAAMLLVAPGLALTVITDTVGLLLTLSATLVFLDNRYASRGPVRLFWTLFTTCWGIRAVVQMVWMYYDVVLRQEAPNPFIGDVLLFLSSIPMLAALLLQAGGRERDESKSSGFVDFALLLMWWLYLYLYFVTPWQYVALDEAKYGFNYNLLNGLVDVVLLVIAALLIKHTLGRWRRFHASFFGAQLSIALSGYLANQAIDHHVYYPGSLYDLPYTVALALFTIVGLMGRSLTKEAPDQQIQMRFPLIKLGMLSLLSLPIITTVTVLIKNPTLRVARFREIVVQGTVLIMSTLIFTRQRRLMTQLSEAAKVLRDMSVTDSLTSCRNRRFLEAALPADASRVLRSYVSRSCDSERVRDLIFYLIDLDDFKQVNDQYGHHVGDSVLVNIAGRISSVARKSDILVRWGGDEFLLVSRESDRAEAPNLARRILEAVVEPIQGHPVGHPEIKQTCSVGWAAFPWRQDKPNEVGCEAVLAFADQALYEAKASGKNRAVGASAAGSSGAEVAGRPQLPSADNLVIQSVISVSP
jgi:diguanylate cyclase (GGDEF)-like protein